jgi:hypothetical protein
VVFPAATPVINPVEACTEATPASALLHVPPDMVLVYVADVPVQTGVRPVMADGFWLTVTFAVLKHPVGRV